MLPVDVWFQIDVHCVSVRAVNKRTKIALMASSIVFFVGLTLLICSYLDMKGAVAVFYGSLLDMLRVDTFVMISTGAALGFIVGNKLIK